MHDLLGDPWNKTYLIYLFTNDWMWVRHFKLSYIHNPSNFMLFFNAILMCFQLMKTAVRAESFLYLSTFIVIYLLQQGLQTIVRLVSLSVLHFNIFSIILTLLHLCYDRIINIWYWLLQWRFYFLTFFLYCFDGPKMLNLKNWCQHSTWLHFQSCTSSASFIILTQYPHFWCY